MKQSQKRAVKCMKNAARLLRAAAVVLSALPFMTTGRTCSHYYFTGQKPALHSAAPSSSSCAMTPSVIGVQLVISLL
eukprot:609869-Rhodomonas_salina.1